MKILSIILLLSVPCFGQSDYKNYLDNTGKINSVYVDNAIRDLYNNKIDKIQTELITGASVQATYLGKSSATATYAPLAGNRIFAGFTSLGTGNTEIKIKTVSGTTASLQDSGIAIAHGLTGDKIIGITAIVRYDTNKGAPPNSEAGNLYYFIWYDATNVNVWNKVSESSSILSKAIVVTIIYIE